MRSVNIRTAQNVDVHYSVASVGERIAASVIDYIIIILYFIGIIFLHEKVFFSKHISSLLILQLPILFYDLFFEVVLNGQSPGKKVMNIKVVKLDGTQPTIGSYIVRWILRFVDLGFSGGTVALCVILINGKGQRLGDIAAGTSVVSLKAKAELEDTILMDLDADYSPQFNNAVNLDDKTISVIKEALVFYKTHKKNSVAADALEKLKEIVQNKMDITHNGDAAEFLETVLKDYNYLNGTVV